MHARSWENVIGAAVLAICLVAGLVLGLWLAPKPQVGLLRFEGAIDIGSAEKLISALEDARQDDRVAAVVLEVASPGGLATSSESIYYTLLNLRAEKPVVVAVDGIAVSGGYYIASAANRIYAPASAYIGNVGTRGPKPNDPTLAPEEMSSGPFKLSGGSRFDRVQQLERVKEAFVLAVMHQRENAELNPLQIDAETVAEARIYLGSEAVSLGLVDAEGGRSDAIAGAAELAMLRDYDVVDLLARADTDGAMLQPDFQSAVKRMVESAPPDAVFLVDSRIPLPGLYESSEVERHLLHLREISPASLETVPMHGAAAESPVPAPSQIGDAPSGAETAQHQPAGEQP